MWGQAGERPTVWVAAADPVFLEPRLDHLRLYALGPENVGKADMRSLFDHLQGVLGRDGAIGFARISSCGYVRSSQPFETATEPPEVVDGRLPGEFLPAGEGAAAFRRRLGEIEMALHEADVNLRRQAAGLQPVNSLWIWGGGMAREQRQVPCPPLFTEDPLLRGYWLSCEARIAAWPGSVAEAVAMATGGFAAVPSIAEGDIDALQSCLLAYQAALSARHIDRLVLSFRDGIEAHLVRTDAVRLWRRRSGLFG